MCIISHGACITHVSLTLTCSLLAWLRTAVGRTAPGRPLQRRPDPGCDASTGTVADYYGVYDNAQVYPEYIVHFT
jgi:hypothetical protein